MATDRRADVTWNGSLMDGSGTIRSTTTGAIGELAVSWAARSEDPTGGETSPEELIAAAHAACFSMALSHALAQAGHAPDALPHLEDHVARIGGVARDERQPQLFFELGRALLELRHELLQVGVVASRGEIVPQSL